VRAWPYASNTEGDAPADAAADAYSQPDAGSESRPATSADGSFL
jgi:hypothetical protein